MTEDSRPAYFAHSTDRTDRADWEPLRTHLSDTAARARIFGGAFRCGDLAHAAALLHDLGKYRPEFQARLSNPAIRAPHAVHGAAFARRAYGQLGQLIAHGIAGHHAGLTDALFDRDGKLAEADSILDAILANARADGLVLPATLAAPAFDFPRDERGFQAAFLARMLFAALVDADYLATEAFYGGAPEERGTAVSVADLRRSLDRHFETFAPPPRGSLNDTRNVIRSHARERAESPPGVFTLTVPTGGGKTLTGLAFALDHAVRHGLDRVVVAIPFTSVIEQTAKVYREALAPHADAVLEHHSAFEESGDERSRRERSGRTKLDLAMENWDRPLVVTTTVQLFESLFSNRPSQCRKLHRLARSVIVLDEVQTLPPGLLRPCVAALKELARNYGSTVVLSTATQPALLEQPDGSGRRSFTKGFRDTVELAPDPPGLFAALQRAEIRHVGKQSDAEIAERIKNAEQVLCIVNTRPHAQSLFEAIRAQPGSRHLSTLMYPLHRRRVLEDIRGDLRAGRSCRVVSTSLVEAGVDVDFPHVLRADAGLDSILQAAGRCNREGGRSREESFTLVFTPEAPVPQDRRLFVESAEEVFREFPDNVATLPAVERYFGLTFHRKGDDGLDAKGILDACNRAASLDFPFRTIADAFTMIDDASLPVIVPADDEARRAIDGLRHLREGASAGSLARRLQRYVVGLNERERAALVASGAAEALQPERFGDQFVVLTDMERYREDVGLVVGDANILTTGQLVI